MQPEPDGIRSLATAEGRRQAFLALRAWAKAKPKHAVASALGVVLVIAWLYDHYGHPGRVFDGATGEPLEGVFVIRGWGTSAGLLNVEPRSACYQMKITQTNASGRYYLPRWSWSIVPGALFASFSGQGTAFYKAGYYEAADPVGNTESRTLLWPETRPAEVRLRVLEGYLSMAYCGDDYRDRLASVPLHEAIADEGESLAQTRTEKVIANDLRWRALHIRLGEMSMQTRDQRKPEPKREKK